MNESLKAILATVTIVACLTLIGVMAYLHVEGAGIAAVSVVGIIVAWLTRAPDRKDPPNIAKIIPLCAAGALLSAILACGCSTPPVELPVVSVETKQKAAGATFQTDLLLCVDNNDTSEAIDACADGVRRFWHRDGGAR